MKGRRFLAWTMLLFILPLSGCWDKVEIEQRAIINSMLVEKGDNGQQAGNSSEKGEKGKLKITFGILIPHAQGKGKDMGYSRVVQGEDMAQVLNLLGEETSRVPFYGQTRMLIFSKDFLKQGSSFKSLLDFIERDPNINTQMRVLVSKDETDKITQIKPQLESSTTDHISGILNNAELLSSTVSVSLENLIDELRESNGSGVLPILEVLPDKQTFRVDELGLIKDYTYLTEVNPEIVKDYKIITDTFSGGRQQVDFEGEKLSAYIYNCKTSKKLKSNKGSLGFKITVEAEGDVDEYSFDKNIMDKDTIERIETELENQMKKELKKSTEYFQKEIGYDYLGLREYIKKYEPKAYKSYEKNWEEQFKNADIEYQVNFHVRRIGTSK
jgi:Ger(x)C family germination protein